MAKQITKYSIFLASPSDLDEERFAVEEIISELNLTYSPSKNIVIELLKWETHAAPGISNLHPQKIINQDIGMEYDLFLGMIWNRFGTKTDEAESGTQEEFNNAIKKFNSDNNSVQIMFYFKNAVPKSMKELNPEELIKIREFKKSLSEKKLLYSEFNSVDDFKSSLRIHLPKRLNSIIENQKSGIMEILPINDTTSNEKELGILDYSEMYESLLGDATNSINKITDYTGAIAKELEKKAEEITRIGKAPNANKFSLNEVMKRTAKLMNDYSNRLETENPIFYNSFEDAIKAGTNIINLTDEFYTDNTINDLQEAKKALTILRRNLPNSIKEMTSFHESVKDLPRIQSDINQAKKTLMIQLEDLILKLEKSLELTIDFSDAISSKIDTLNILNETND
jgi:hypothetical protein